MNPFFMSFLLLFLCSLRFSDLSALASTFSFSNHYGAHERLESVRAFELTRNLKPRDLKLVLLRRR